MSSRQGSAGTHRHVYDSCYIASDPADTLYGWIRTLRARADKLTEHFWCPACRRAQSCSAARREHHHSGRTSSGPSERLGSSASMPVSRPQAVLAARGPFQGRFRAWTGPTRRAPSHAKPRLRKRVKTNDVPTATYTIDVLTLIFNVWMLYSSHVASLPVVPMCP